MHRPAVGATLALLALVLGGCNIFSSERTSNASTDEPSRTVAPAPEAFEAAPVATDPTNDKVPATLTRPTNPDERRLVIKSGRSDPFEAVVKVAPSPSPRNSNTPSGNSKASPSSRPANSPPSQGRSPFPSQGRSPSPKKVLSPSGGKQKAQPTTPKSNPKPAIAAKPESVVLPPLPQAEVAKGITVKGIVSVGKPQAIIQAPEEPTTRTVGVGERLAQGRVVVKGFDFSNPNGPLVIFEESGTQVAAGVGQEGYIIASAATP